MTRALKLVGLWTAAGVFVATFTQTNAQTIPDPTGRWEFAYTPPSNPGQGAARTNGRAGGDRGGAGSGERRVFLELRRGPGNTLTGTIDLNPGGRSAPGSNAERPVEIADGRIDGARLSFSAWQMDRYANRIQFEGTVSGEVLTLTLSRATSAGTQKTDVTAHRSR